VGTRCGVECPTDVDAHPGRSSSDIDEGARVDEVTGDGTQEPQGETPNGEPAGIQYGIPEDVPAAGAPTAAATSSTGGAGDVLVTIGDIACTQTTVITPNGSHSLAGTNWIVANNTRTSEKIPTYAIVLAIVLALACLLGLLFLLIKEQVTEGTMQVTVQSDDFFYSTHVPVSDPAQIVDIEQRVNYARGLVRSLAE